MDKLYRQYDAKIILPVHDAYVFECPLGHLQVVAELTSRVMIEVVVELFPVLRPRTDINIEYPQSWNKDGQHDALEKWIETPVVSLEGGRSWGYMLQRTFLQRSIVFELDTAGYVGRGTRSYG